MKKYSRHLVCLLFFMVLTAQQDAWGQFQKQTSLNNSCVQVNGMYVDGFFTKLGNTMAENRILEFARHNGFNYLLLYEMHLIISNPTKQEQLALFIERARRDYHIHQVAAVMESAAGIEAYVAYNRSHTKAQGLDVFNLEFEFWSSHLDPYCAYLGAYGACNRANAFRFYIDQIRLLEAAATPILVETEVYIGWPTQQEAIAIANEVDRVLIHFYRTTDVEIIQYGLERLMFLGQGNKRIKIAPIFSSEGPGNTADLPFMGEWLKSNPIDKAYESWINGYQEQRGAWKDKLEIMGASWFCFGRFNTSYSSTITLQPTANSLVCVGGHVTLTTASNASNKKFYWMKNGECLTDNAGLSGTKTAQLSISNFKAQDTGKYTCRVVSYDATNPSSFTTNTAQVKLSSTCQKLPYGGVPWSIPGLIEAEDYDQGGANVAYYDLTAANEGNAYRNESVDIEPCMDVGGGFNVGWMDGGEWIDYSTNVTKAGQYRIALRIAALNGGGQVRLFANNKAISNIIDIPSTGGWQSYTTITFPTTNGLETGSTSIRVQVLAGGFNLNSIAFSQLPPNAPPIVSLTLPASNSIFSAPAMITLNALASDSDGAITKVEFYNGSTLLYSDNVAPYTYTWTNVAAGSYTISARATDNAGAVGVGAAVSVVVNTVLPNACSGVAQYVENGGYAAGSKVQNGGILYQCKPWPYAGWCNGGAWAYAPGTGAYWADAWTKIGNCAARMSAVDQVDEVFSVYPNPALTSITFKTDAEVVATYRIFNAYGLLISSGSITRAETIVEIAELRSGMYIVEVNLDQQQWKKVFFKQ